MEKINDNIKRVCKACLKEKDLKSFYRSKANPDGFDARCKLCKKQGILLRERKPKKIPNLDNLLKLTNPTKENYKDMFLFLQAMGYSLESNIHEQFCEKYDLKPKKRRQKANNKYTVEEIFS